MNGKELAAALRGRRRGRDCCAIRRDHRAGPATGGRGEHKPVKGAEKTLTTCRAVRAKDAVFLLNVCPHPWGDIQPEEQRGLRVGGRLRRGPLPSLLWQRRGELRF